MDGIEPDRVHAVRLAEQVLGLSVGGRFLVFAALLGNASTLAEIDALGHHEATGTGRLLDEILRDVEDGGALSPGEQAMLGRLAQAIALPPKSRREFADAWHAATAAVAVFAPPGKPSERARWVVDQSAKFMRSPDWKRSRFNVLPPALDPLRVALWTLSRMGGPPRDRLLREIVGDLARSDTADIANI